MKVAALIFGILGSLSALIKASIGYAIGSLFVGIGGTQYGHLWQLLSVVIPLLCMAGTGAVMPAPAIGGGLLLSSALLILVTAGFNFITFTTCLLLVVAGVLGLCAAGSEATTNQAAPAGPRPASPSPTPIPIPTEPTSVPQVSGNDGKLSEEVEPVFQLNDVEVQKEPFLKTPEPEPPPPAPVPIPAPEPTPASVQAERGPVPVIVSAPPPPTSKRSGTVWLPITLIIVLVCGLAGSGAYYYISHRRLPSASSNTSSDQPVITAFLEGIYSHYHGNAGREMSFNPTRQSAAQVFDPQMIALIAANRQKKNAGDMALVDEADPLCQCQDSAGLKATIEHVRVEGPGFATATANIQFPGGAPPTHLFFELSLVSGEWRIHDLRNPPHESLRTLLEQDNSAPHAVAPALPSSETYTDPFAYCRAVGTVDDPSRDGRFKGPEYPPILEKLRPSFSAHVWRCLDGKVMGCVPMHPDACTKADTNRVPLASYQQFCQQRPNGNIPYAVTGHSTIYEWNCRGTVAEVGKQITNADARGFLPGVWEEVSAVPEQVSQSPQIAATPPASAGRFRKSACGAIVDQNSGLEWYVGPDTTMPWNAAIQWVNSLEACDAGWRMPTLSELKTLFNPNVTAGVGYSDQGKNWPAHIDPIFSGIGQGSWVWSVGTAEGSTAPAINFNQDIGVRLQSNPPYPVRTFAVRTIPTSNSAAATSAERMALIRKAKNEVDQGNFAGGINDLTQAWRQETRPGALKFFYYERGHAYRLWGKYQSAIADFTQGLESDTQNNPVCGTIYERGVSYEALGMRDKAIADYRLAISKNGCVDKGLSQTALQRMGLR